MLPFDPLHMTAYLLRRIIEGLQREAARIEALANAVGELKGPDAKARTLIDKLRNRETLKTAILFKIMAQTPQQEWPRASEGISIGEYRGHIVTCTLPQQPTGEYSVIDVPEVVQRLDGNVDYWLSLYDQGLFQDLAIVLHGLASEVRTAMPFDWPGLNGGVKRAMERLRDLAQSQIQASGATASKSDEGETGASVIEDNVFRKEGDSWRVKHRGGETFSLRGTRGLCYVAELLGNPGRRIHVLDLVGVGQQREGRAAPEHYSQMSHEELAEQGMSVSGLGDAGPAADRRAIAECQKRRNTLRELIAACNDPARLAELKEDLEHFEEYLGRARGLGGRPRPQKSADERARVAVKKNITNALDQIGKHDEALKRHFLNTIRTGTYCSYGPAELIHWAL